MSTIYNWLLSNWIEILAVVTGLLYIVLSVRQNIWCWLFGIISSGVYLVVFFNSKIYADMSLQIYYVVIGFYGWIYWGQIDKSENSKEIPVTRLTQKSSINLLLITLALFFIIAWFLIRFTDSPIPWVDAFTTALSFTATWMLARKVLEHWLIWILVDGVSLGLYFYRGLYVSIILFAVLTILAVYGYFEWKAEWTKKQLKAI